MTEIITCMAAVMAAWWSGIAMWDTWHIRKDLEQLKAASPATAHQSGRKEE